MSFEKLSEIVELSKKNSVPFWKVIMMDDQIERGVSEEESFALMGQMYSQMKLADESYDATLKSVSGMAGGDGEKIEQYKEKRNSLVGDFVTEIMEKAIKMGESNACMRRIVAAPTAGSCGVIPAVLLAYENYRNVSDEEIIKALFVAAGIGSVIATSASISGAEGGCQAEIGSASAMAAGAITYLEGGDNKQIINAVALALKNMLGLTCDPVAGLVEVPCIKRNVAGAVNAVTSSQLAMAGIISQIPPDEVIDSMRRIGKLIPPCLKETSQEGLATTHTGMLVANKLSVRENLTK